MLVHSEQLPEDAIEIHGHDFNETSDIDAVMASMLRTGLQATALGQAINEVNRMLSWRLSQEPLLPDDKCPDPAERAIIRCKIFLGYTSNLVSAGVREHIKFLVQHKLVDVVVTTAGGIEEDLIKCMAPTYVGDFQLKGADLRKRGLNRVGNMLVPNSNYCKFEDWVMPILDAMVTEQEQNGISWTPSKVIERLGREINHPDSICYWAARNGIPIFCPALTDVMKNGADFAVYWNTAQEFDGSDSGARPDEAVSWGKIRPEATPVKVCGDASILFPLLISQTFAKEVERRKHEGKTAATAVV